MVSVPVPSSHVQLTREEILLSILPACWTLVMVTLVVYNLQEFLSKVYKKIAGTLTLHYPGFEMVLVIRGGSL